MESLKYKIALMFVIGLSIFQFSLAILMTENDHNVVCAFDEHCILQSMTETAKAVPPLLTIVLPVFFVFTQTFRLQFAQEKKYNSPKYAVLRETLKGIIKRE